MKCALITADMELGTLFISLLIFNWIIMALPAVTPTGRPFILPEVFGNFHLNSCSDAPTCGTVMASFNGIDAFSNGDDQCTAHSCIGYSLYGYEYQCVELAQRYFAQLYGTDRIWPGNAIDMCDTFPRGVELTASPAPGDLVVFRGGVYGHVAVITGVGEGTLNVMEQNASPTGTNTYSVDGNIKCFLHATSSTRPQLEIATTAVDGMNAVGLATGLSSSS